MSSESSSRLFAISTSPDFPDWLASVNASLAFSTYQLGKIFFVGLKTPGRIGVFERTFNRCMGLWSDTQTLWLASAFQLWRMENMLEPGKTVDESYDRLFVPMQAITTGDIDVHDLAVDQNGELFFVNTLFSCVAKVSDKYSFEPIWKPPFVSRIAAGDRCHLNGLATDQGEIRFATACAQTDEPGAWRDHRRDGGCVIDIATNDVVVTGLSMPHSPRMYDGKLWLLDSGNGYFGFVDLDSGKFEKQVFCPGYARGMTFIGKYAIVGLSKPREKTFSGLTLDDELAKYNAQPQCGLQVIDLERGAVVQWMAISGNVEELYDVIALPDVRMPKAFGTKTDEIRKNTWLHENGKLSRWTAADG
ncbi:MAG: TIGR03032 family protein [Planctomycetales bacterium]|nr:TIGR03032 family protein [Planctomycetales bacterium]